MNGVDNFEKYADLYDAFNQEKNYREEVDFVLTNKLSISGSSNILDLGCGTGKHAFYMANAGCTVTAIDKSQQMINRALSHERIKYHVADIENYKSSHKFDLITSFFHVFSYLTELNDLKKVLVNCSENLSPDGYIFFDFWYTPAVMYQKPRVRMKSSSLTENITAKRITNIEENFEDKKVKVCFDFYLHDKNKSPAAITHFSEIHTMRHFDITEIEYVAKYAGLKIEFFGEMLTDNKLSRNTWNAYAILRKT